MKEFQYTIKDPLGIRARPAGLLTKAAKGYGDTVITVTRENTAVGVSHLMRLIGLDIKQGNEITVTAEGPAEDEAIAAMKKFFEENL